MRRLILFLILGASFNVFAGGWVGSPAAAELEIVTMNWLLKLFKFPSKKGGGIFTSGGSMANLTALVTARRQRCGDDFSKAIIYMSDQAHSSNIKAIRVLGFKKEQISIIPTDIEFKIAINKLKNAIAGISIAIDPRIHLGDFIEVEKVKGKIIQFGLTKTVIETDELFKVMVPNVKFDEEIIRIESKKKKKNIDS